MWQSTYQERLGNKEGPRGDTWISLERGNRRDLLSGLGDGEDGNMRDEVGVEGWRRRVLKEMTGNGEGISDSNRNLVQGQLPGIYKRPQRKLLACCCLPCAYSIWRGVITVWKGPTVSSIVWLFLGKIPLLTVHLLTDHSEDDFYENNDD